MRIRVNLSEISFVETSSWSYVKAGVEEEETHDLRRLETRHREMQRKENPGKSETCAWNYD
jgi:hypothetical protein